MFSHPNRRQHKLWASGGRILDFLIIAEDDAGNKKLLNVECDGAEYHTHNVSMAEYLDDRERDKMIEGCGIEVIRFSGSAIWRYAADCADEVALTLKAWRWKRRGRNVIALSA